MWFSEMRVVWLDIMVLMLVMVMFRIGFGLI